MNFNFLSFFKKLNVPQMVSGANRTLSIAKKAIPVYKEIKPFFEGKKSIFKKENVKDDDVSSRPIAVKETSETRGSYNDNLTFFQ